MIVPVVVTNLFNYGTLKPEKDKIKDLCIELPANSPEEWDLVYTGESFNADKEISVCNALSDFPVVLIKNRKQVWS